MPGEFRKYPRIVEMRSIVMARPAFSMDAACRDASCRQGGSHRCQLRAASRGSRKKTLKSAMQN